ncbi:MAG: FecR domain-containing protein, partial [Opitutaceae bacterium]
GNDEVPVKAVLKTSAGASAMLAFPSGTAVHLGANSEFTLEVFAQEPFASRPGTDETAGETSVSRVVVRLVRGELAAQIKSLRRSSFNIATDAGVLWTQRDEATFLVVATATEVVVTVTEGEMNFRPPGKEPLVIGAGNRMRAEVFGAELLRER